MPIGLKRVWCSTSGSLRLARSRTPIAPHPLPHAAFGTTHCPGEAGLPSAPILALLSLEATETLLLLHERSVRRGDPVVVEKTMEQATRRSRVVRGTMRVL